MEEQQKKELKAQAYDLIALMDKKNQEMQEIQRQLQSINQQINLE